MSLLSADDNFFSGFFIDCCLTSYRWLRAAFRWIWLDRTILIFCSILMSMICLSSTSYSFPGSFLLRTANYSRARSMCLSSLTPVILRISLVSMILPSGSLKDPSRWSTSYFSCSEPELGSHSTLGALESGTLSSFRDCNRLSALSSKELALRLSFLLR